MKIFVKVKPSAKEEKIHKVDDTHFRVLVKEPPVQGRANTAVVSSLADYFQVSKEQINILSGFTSREKNNWDWLETFLISLTLFGSNHRIAKYGLRIQKKI